MFLFMCEWKVTTQKASSPFLSRRSRQGLRCSQLHTWGYERQQGEAGDTRTHTQACDSHCFGLLWIIVMGQHHNVSIIPFSFPFMRCPVVLQMLKHPPRSTLFTFLSSYTSTLSSFVIYLVIWMFVWTQYLLYVRWEREALLWKIFFLV